MSPATSEDYKDEQEIEKTEAEIERALIRSYGRSGYKVWLKGAEEEDGSVTVMGRIL